MKLTKTKLKQIIREEIQKLNERTGKYSSLDGMDVIYHGPGKYSGKKGIADVDNGVISISFGNGKFITKVDVSDIQIVKA